MPTRGYLSQVELPVTFGLGLHEEDLTLAITWPDGTHQEVPVEGGDRLVVIEQP